jgi:hypothetical protein
MYRFPQVDSMYWERSPRPEKSRETWQRRVYHPLPGEPPCSTCDKSDTCGDQACESFRAYASGSKNVNRDRTPSKEIYSIVFPERIGS